MLLRASAQRIGMSTTHAIYCLCPEKHRSKDDANLSGLDLALSTLVALYPDKRPFSFLTLQFDLITIVLLGS